ncbi:alkaline phosphatase family protein [Herbidospora mongoliensis]|uniref:alkaline phosphatase family protein n=1 Tax=Herbidospora mongoliensis TaxID=688067 RepID=UPI0008353A79|nr:alkaline phosphatase family protein [Herbidospora mongoliensis]
MATLADIAGSVYATFDGTGGGALGLDPADKVCLFIVDGLGADLLAAHPSRAPFLSSALARVLTAGFPSSTPVSLATIGTGVLSGHHGMLGIQVAVPGEGRLLNCLRWTTDGPPIAPDTWQPLDTVFQRLAHLDVASSYVAPAVFDGTGLTQAVYRGVRYVPADTLDERVEGVHAALRATPKAYVTCYYGHLDSMGHMMGWGSPEWLDQLAIVDGLAERLAGALPPGGVLYVTADHGMINATDKIDLDLHPELTEGIALFGGDPRGRHLYTLPGSTDSVLQAWRAVLGERAQVASREEAIDSGWFGPVNPELLGRIGDVVVVTGGGCVIASAGAEPLEWSMIGHHGSLTPAEQNVPFLEIRR